MNMSTNDSVRKVFNDYYEANNKPQLKILAKKMNTIIENSHKKKFSFRAFTL